MIYDFDCFCYYFRLAASIQAEEEGGLAKNASKFTAAVPCEEDGEEDDEEMILVSSTRLMKFTVYELEFSEQPRAAPSVVHIT